MCFYRRHEPTAVEANVKGPNKHRNPIRNQVQRCRRSRADAADGSASSGLYYLVENASECIAVADDTVVVMVAAVMVASHRIAKHFATQLVEGSNYG